jgi:hypothetical protein
MGLDSPTLDAYMASLPPALDLEKTYVDTATITKRIRAELAAAVTAGVFPAGTRFAVRKDHHKSIDVDIVAWDGAVLCDAYIDHVMDATTRDKIFESEATRVLGRHGWRYGDKRCTVALNQAMVDADRLANRHNYNNSDSMTDYFDVGYYLDVDANTVIGLAEQAIRAESDPALAELTARASSPRNASVRQWSRVTAASVDSTRAKNGRWSDWSISTSARKDGPFRTTSAVAHGSSMRTRPFRSQPTIHRPKPPRT